MACLSNAAFSPDGHYFAFYHTDGKLKIWDTVTGVLKQEYTPNEHLTLPCSALAWGSLPHLMMSPGKKKKHRIEEENHEEGASSSRFLLLGLTSGSVLIYSLSSGGIRGELPGPGLAVAVKSLAWAKHNDLYSGCADGTIVYWHLPTKQVTSKWRASKSPVSALLAHSSQPWLLSASQKITVWDRKRHVELQSIAGHASPISRLMFVPGESFFVSMASGDRHINVWSLNPEDGRTRTDVTASFVLPDQPVQIDVGGDDKNGTVRLAAITEGGVLHSFTQQLTGKRQLPSKPKLTVQIASSVEPSDGKAVECIPILGSLVSRDDPSLLHIAHGNSVVLRFEKINATSKDVMWLVRQPPKRLGYDHVLPTTSKVKVSYDNDTAHYVTAAGVKRSRDAGSAKQLPIEQRINNLSVSVQTVASSSRGDKGMPCADSLAQLLTQGLQSSDQKLLRGILLNKDTSAIASTVSRLAPGAVPLLLQELAVIVHWRGWKGEAATRWLHALLVHHGAQVLSCPELPQLLGPLLGLIEARLAQVAPLARLRGRLSLLLGQLAHSRTAKNASQSTKIPDEEHELQSTHLHYQDGEDSSSDEFGLDNSDSEEQWTEGQAADDDDTEEEEEEDEEERRKEETPMVNGDDELSSEQGECKNGQHSDEEMELSS